MDELEVSTDWRDRARAAAADALSQRPGLVLSVAGVAMVLLSGGLWWWSSARVAPPPVEDRLPLASPAAAPATPPAPAPVVVHAAGAVARPGLYELPAGARVAELLAAAGGPVDDADLDRLNLAAELVDGTRVLVPRRGESVDVVIGAGVDEPDEPSGPMRLSTADAALLDTLPGIGPSLAAAIVAHRDDHGPFERVDDLLDVPGIGPAKLDALRDLVVP